MNLASKKSKRPRVDHERRNRGQATAAVVFRSEILLAREAGIREFFHSAFAERDEDRRRFRA